MNPKPLVPDTEILPLFYTLHETSQKILGASHLADLSQLNALLHARAQLLEQLTQLELGQCSETLRDQLQAVFQKVQELEPEILQQVQKLRDNLEGQIAAIQDARSALTPYKLKLSEHDSTRSTEA